jgi:hypothetical protein
MYRDRIISGSQNKFLDIDQDALKQIAIEKLTVAKNWLKQFSIFIEPEILLCIRSSPTSAVILSLTNPTLAFTSWLTSVITLSSETKYRSEGRNTWHPYGRSGQEP